MTSMQWRTLTVDAAAVPAVARAGCAGGASPTRAAAKTVTAAMAVVYLAMVEDFFTGVC